MPPALHVLHAASFTALHAVMRGVSGERIALHTSHFTLPTPHFTLHTSAAAFTLHTPHSSLHTAHFRCGQHTTPFSQHHFGLAKTIAKRQDHHRRTREAGFTVCG